MKLFLRAKNSRISRFVIRECVLLSLIIH
jgi:hypothetical protein